MMASNPISSWQIGVKKLETVAHFIFLVSKITVDSDYSHKIERHLHLERTAMTNLDRVLKSKDITLSTKVHLVKAMIFPVVTYICERWTEKKPEHRRIDVFQLWCGEDSWESLDSKEIKLVNPKGNPPWIFIGRTDAKVEAPILWPIWWEEPTHWKRLWCWERLKTGGKGDDRGWDGWMASPTRWTWIWASSGSWWWTGKPGMLQSMGHKELNMT